MKNLQMISLINIKGRTTFQSTTAIVDLFTETEPTTTIKTSTDLLATLQGTNVPIQEENTPEDFQAQQQAPLPSSFSILTRWINHQNRWDKCRGTFIRIS
ncbi:unnamed protein product [Cuscuta epithymum]|uniref:Uncharacterized protein n=1 Tax=Cuscuta epithymum TaxID=186058 RepID=A0AAV0CXI2_9ASTE|nr:unnamed protein product [Cuscuta epithymum]